MTRERVSEIVPRGTMDLLDTFVELIRSEAVHQNLIAASTLEEVWARHILDSLQLLDLAGSAPTRIWLDVGSGAGLPGLVVAIASEWEVLLVEPRAKRADFLRRASASLRLNNRVEVISRRVEAVQNVSPAIISARAVAKLDTLFGMAGHLAASDTRWLLPKGRSANEEVASARETWQGHFSLVPSITDAAARIVVARDVRRKGEP